AEHAAPGLPEHMIRGGDAEMLDEIVELVDEQLHGPEIGALVAQMRRKAAAQLIIMDDRADTLCQALEAIEIVVRRAGTAMERHNGQLAAVELARDAIPGLVAPEVREAFARANLGHAAHPPCGLFGGRLLHRLG